MALQIPNHAHCVICTRAVPFGDKTCSDDCEKKYDLLQKRRKRSIMFLYGLMGMTLLLFLLANYGILSF